MPERNFTLNTEKSSDQQDKLSGNFSIDILFPVVAIGLSAGGKEAVSRLLAHLPPALGMTYIVIQNGPPDQEEISPEQLAKTTEMKICLAKDGLLLEKDSIYIIPPDTYMCIEQRKLTLFPRVRTEGGYHSIDFFLTALATACKARAIAVILSGITPDGAAGIRAIRAEGGITIAQDDTARFKGMPHNAIDSGYIDFVGSPEQIAVELAALREYIPSGSEAATMGDNNYKEPGKICLLLLEKHGTDFTLYSQAMVNRRILRRMRFNKMKDMDDYTRLLQDDDRELDLLHRDLLLHMTGFFREPEMYRALTKDVLPDLLKNKKNGEPIRLWIPACHTGEEAWSVAIILQEYWKDKALGFPIRIFATDLSASTISKARTGLYSKIVLQNVSTSRVKEYFIKTEGGYQVGKQIRDLCVFAVQDLLNDPPFSLIDIICCENRAISLEPGPQMKVARAFHYALKPSGSLLLGRFGMSGLPAELFTPSENGGCIHRRNDLSLLPVYPVSGEDPGKEADRLLLSRYVPAGILVDKDLRILRFYGNTAAYCRPSAGKASLDLFRIVREELVFDLENLLAQAKRNHRTVTKEGIRLTAAEPGAENASRISLEVIPLGGGPDPDRQFIQDPDRLLIVIRTPTGARPEDGQEKEEPIELEKELRAARLQLLTISEAFEKAREEFRFRYEDVLSSNEELQSMNEQLDNSNIELRSSNEGLESLVKELRFQRDEWKESAQYARAIVDTIREPLIVLNGNGRIHRANKAFYDSFGLRPRKVEGHYLYEIDHDRFNIEGLQSKLQSILRRRTGSEEFEWGGAFPGQDEKIILFRMQCLNDPSLPSYRILLTLEDITDRCG